MVSTQLRVKELLKERSWSTKTLAEKTGMSESYLTHIKNGTRRWNEDALKKIAEAFETDPIDIFATRPARVAPQEAVELSSVEKPAISIFSVPVMGDIPSHPSAYNNQLMQVTTGYKEIFVPILNHADDAMFAICLENNAMAPRFVKGDYLIISPSVATQSGDLIAVEYKTDKQMKGIMQVTYMDDFILLESVNHKSSPVALVKNKDNFRVIGKVIQLYQKLG